jgi:uncharacterized heparinase superfamily protein
MLDGLMVLDGGALRLGETGDPFDQPSPTRQFATALHGFDWLPHLLAAGPGGDAAGPAAAAGLAAGVRDLERLLVERRAPGAAHLPPGLRRPRPGAEASDAEISAMALDIARQRPPAAEGLRRARAQAGARRGGHAIAGCALTGKASDRLMDQGLKRVEALMDAVVLADGGHASRSPEAGLELLFDLLTLDDALGQRGRPPPEAVSRAIDRLSSSACGSSPWPTASLAAFQGGEAVEPPDRRGPGP